MLKERRVAATMVADNLFLLERAIDASLTQSAALTTAMLSARETANLSAVTGSDAFNQLAEANSMLFHARHHLVEMHKALQETRTEIGLREVSFGDLSKCPPGGPAAAEGGVGLKMVA